MSDLPSDWRERIVALLTGPEADEGWTDTLIADAPRRSPARQRAIYREQIARRLARVLRGAVAGLAAYEDEDFDALATAYLGAHPPTSWTLHRLADALPQWLAANPSSDPVRDADRRDLVALDLAVGRARRAATASPIAAIEATTPLRHAPSLTVLHLDRPWHRWRASVLTGPSPAIPEPAPTTVAVYRREGLVRDQELHPAEARLLLSFAAPCTLAEALAHAAAAEEDPSTLIQQVGPWFQRFAARGWLVAATG